jgi:hypothetical protein
MLTTEQIARNYAVALETAKKFTMGIADVQLAAKRLASALDNLEIPYAIAGGLAVAAHGHLRMTVDVDVLLTPDGLQRFKDRWLGRGWVERFAGSRGLRDGEHDVKIDVILTGDFPGDGKPKPVEFPDPEAVAIDLGDSKVVNLETLLELKLASGMTAPHRLQDFADVIALIRANQLDEALAGSLDPFVADKYRELWALAQTPDDSE